MARHLVIQPSIVFVHLGPELPAWLPTTLRQARLFNSCEIVLIAEAAALAQANVSEALRSEALRVVPMPLEELGLSDKHRMFRRLSPLDQRFRDGFWTFTSERFFVIESAMKKLSLQNVIHLENDMMLYCSLDTLVVKLSRLYRSVAATFDNDTRCVPGIVYFPTPEAIGAVTDFYLYIFQKLASSPQARSLNDMQVLGALRAQGRHIIDHLPIVPADYPGELRSAVGHTVQDPANYSRHFESLGVIFDAAALGQFLGGVDPRNGSGPSIGFINESCVFDPCVLRPRMTPDGDGRRIPLVETASGTHAVANLHVHSKNVAPFLSI